MNHIIKNSDIFYEYESGLLRDHKQCIVVDGAPYIIYINSNTMYSMSSCNICNNRKREITLLCTFVITILRHIHITCEQMVTKVKIYQQCCNDQICLPYIISLINKNSNILRRPIIDNSCPVPSSLMKIVNNYLSMT